MPTKWVENSRLVEKNGGLSHILESRCPNPHNIFNYTMTHDDTYLLVPGSTGLMACVAYRR